MTQQFTASDVRRTAAAIEDKQMLVSSMLRAFADLLEAQEKAVPVAYAEFADNGCVRVWSREYKDRLPGTQMVPLYTHPAQAQPPAARVTDEYQEIARLIGSIFCAGGFKAETWNERELERLLKKTGNWFDNVDQVPKPFLAAQGTPDD